MNSTQYTTRWKSRESEHRLNKILQLLKRGKANEKRLRKFTDLTSSGLIDLRGLPIEAGLDLKNSSFRNIDLSYSTLNELVIQGCEFINVKFDSINCSRWNERNSHFNNVSFIGSKLLDAAMGLFCSTYNEVNFNRTDFSGTFFYCGQFHNCDFSDAHIKNIDFSASSFNNCKFRGRIEGVWFRKNYRFPDDYKRFGKAAPNEMLNIDFSEVELWDCTFTGDLNLSNIHLPQDGSHILFREFRQILIEIMTSLSTIKLSDRDRNNLRFLIDSYMVHAQEQTMWIINRNEIIDYLGPDLGEFFIELLEKTERDIA